MNKQDLFAQIQQDKNKIINKTKKVNLTDAEKKDIYAPEIVEEDSCLVRIVKNILKERQINLKELSPKFKDQMELNNFKRSLRIHHTMSFERFERWMEILDYDWDLTVVKREINGSQSE